ncbi:ARM repeat-containing protein [Schizopora paradoxa]|uniref:MMS19 nucleotide excision repair protein n=1 Tax=Schizopora paradoxa TaxID=27342 RepID=A0A0H2SBH8_9AGAM|nr:ARM repeat-containing protein [Schizopora paradoxa]
MESTVRLVRTWMASERDEEVKQTVADLSTGKASLLDVVKALGEYLPSEDDNLRTKGVEFLSKVLEDIPPSCVNKQATHMLAVFYTNKLEDTATNVPALKGIIPLISLPTITSQDVTLIFNALTTHVNMKELAQSARYIAFKILDSMIARHRSVLQGMGEQFLEGYVSIVDGEKDPRNLMLAFAIDRVLCIEFDISKHIEEMFNIIFCYFPITFRPPKDDPYGITPDDLRNALQSCLCASASFGRLAFPLFLEKLYAGSPLTKGDILDSIALCLPIYGPAETQAFAKKLWNAMKLEIFQPVNPEIEEKALASLRVLVKTLYEVPDETLSNASEPKGLVSDILSECVELLNEPEKSQAIPASKVVASLIGSTSSVTQYVLNRVVPLLVSLFRKREEIPNRPQILTLLCVVIAAVESNQVLFAEDADIQKQLQGYKDDILGVFVAGFKSDDSREATIEGLRKLIGIKGVIAEEEMTFIVHTITEVLQASAQNSEVSCDDTLDLLITIAKDNSKIVEEITLPTLFSSLPDSAPDRSAVSERLGYWQILQWLEKLCTTPPLFETLVVRLTTKLDLICSPATLNIDSNDDREPIAAYAYCILATLAAVLQTKENGKHTDIPKYAERLVPKLFNLFFFLCLTPEIGTFTTDNPRLISVAAKVISIVTRSLSFAEQEKLSTGLQAAYFNDEPKQVASGFQKLPEAVQLEAFDVRASPEKQNLAILFAAPVIGFRKGVFISSPDSINFLKKVQSWSLEISNHTQREAAHHIIAATLNKNVEELSPFVEYQLGEFWTTEIEPKEQAATRRQNAIESWHWILKSLVARNHETAVRFVAPLMQLFSDDDVAWDAARAIGRAVALEGGVLDKKNHVVVKILYAQRYFQAILPKLLDLTKGPAGDPQRRASLVAMSFLISSLPKSVYVSEMTKLMTHLIRGLDLPDAQIRASIFDTLSTVAETASAEQSDIQGVIAEHAHTLTTVALQNALPKDVTSVSLRVSALKLLGGLPQAVRYDILHPQKPFVLRELGRALDDPKRSVRKEAINARGAWFLYKG